MSTVRHASLITCALVVTTLLCGCGQGDTPNLGQVTGVVKLDGKPASDVIVSFESETISKNAVGTTDENGKYELMYGKNIKGAPIGMCTVRFMRKMNPEKGIMIDDIPVKYNRESQEKREVKAGKQEFNFELSST